jgi:uncharacterized repeat protein (TIGR02543 family)
MKSDQNAAAGAGTRRLGRKATKRRAKKILAMIMTVALMLSLAPAFSSPAFAASYAPYANTTEYPVDGKTYYDVYDTAARDLSEPIHLFRQALGKDVGIAFDTGEPSSKSLPLWQWWRYIGQAALTGDEDLNWNHDLTETFGESIGATGPSYLNTLLTAKSDFVGQFHHGATWEKNNTLYEATSLTGALNDIGTTVANRESLNSLVEQPFIHSIVNSKLIDGAATQPVLYSVDSIATAFTPLVLVPSTATFYYVDLMATVFYDFKLAYVNTGGEISSAVTGAKTIEEAKAKAGGSGDFTFSEDSPKTTFMTGVSNNTATDVSAQQDTGFTRTSSVTNTVSDMDSSQYGFEQSIGSETQFQLGVPLIGEIEETVSTNFGSSQVFSLEHSTENSTTNEDSESMNSTISVSLPPHTTAVLKQSQSDVSMSLKYDYPVAISFKVKHLFFRYIAYKFPVLGTIELEGGSGFTYDFGNAAAGHTNAADNLANRWKYRATPGYENSHGGSDINWTDAYNNHTNYDICTEDLAMSKGTGYGDRLEKVINKLYDYRPMSVTGGTLNYGSKGVLSEFYGISPIYPLDSVAQAGGARDYDMSPGETLSVDSIAVEGFDADDVPYYGFNGKRGHWKLVDENGAEISDSDPSAPAKLVKSDATGHTSIVANDAGGTVFLKYFIDEDLYTYGTNFGNFTKQNDLSKTAVIQVNISDPPFKGNVYVTGKLTGIVGDPDINLDDPDDSGIKASVTDESGKEVTRAIIWQAKELASEGIDLQNNSLSFTQPGTFHIRATSGDAQSDWFEVTALPARKLDRIEIADTASPAALRIDAATLPQTLNLSALASVGALVVEGFDQYGSPRRITSQTPFEATGATVDIDPVTSDSMIKVTTVGAISVYVKDGGVESNRLDVTFTNLPKPPEPELPVVQAVPDTSTLTYDGNGGVVQGATTRTVTEKSAYGAHSAATRKGYTFTGWYTERDGGSEITDATVVTQTQDHTIYAHWTANKYKVKFNINKGKTIKAMSKNTTFDAKIGKLPAVKRTGYVFKGWYSKKSGGVKITANTVYETAGDKTVYAQWRKPVLMGKLNKKTTAVHIRKSATKKSAVLGYYEKGDTFRIYGKVDRKGTRHDWYMVKENGKAGFVWAPVITAYKG